MLGRGHIGRGLINSLLLLGRNIVRGLITVWDHLLLYGCELHQHLDTVLQFIHPFLLTFFMLNNGIIILLLNIIIPIIILSGFRPGTFHHHLDRGGPIFDTRSGFGPGILINIRNGLVQLLILLRLYLLFLYLLLVNFIY